MYLSLIVLKYNNESIASCCEPGALIYHVYAVLSYPANNFLISIVELYVWCTVCMRYSNVSAL